MDLGLAGRVALVTGGSKGIGRSIAATLAGEGVDVAIGARGAEELQKAAEEIRSLNGGRCLPVAVDLGELADCQRFVQTTVDHYGRADILVCCANPERVAMPFQDIPDERWVEHMNVKFLSVVRCAREVLPHMRKNGWGRIILISGMATRVVRTRSIDNGPACAALTNFGKQLANQVARDGIRVNTVHPDSTRTPNLMLRMQRQAVLRGVPLEELEKAEAAGKPLGRLLEPREIADLVAFLASDRAGAISGQSIAVDGSSYDGVHY